MPKNVTILDDDGKVIKTDTINPLLGQRIREARQSKGLTIRELAALVNCSATHVTRIETAQRRVVNTPLLLQFAKVLGLPSEELISLAGMGVSDISSLSQVAYPGIQSDKQKEVLDALSKLVTNMTLTDEQLDALLTQATAYAEYCKRKNFCEANQS